MGGVKACIFWGNLLEGKNACQDSFVGEMSPNDVENCKKRVHLKTMYNISTKKIYNAVFLEGVDRDPTKPKSHTILRIPQDSYLYKLWLLWTQNYPFGRVQRSKPKVAVMGSKQVPNVTCPLLWRYSGHVPISPPSRPRRTDWALHLHPTTTLTINLSRCWQILSKKFKPS